MPADIYACAHYIPSCQQPCARCGCGGHRVCYSVTGDDETIICLSCLCRVCAERPIRVIAHGLTSAERDGDRDDIGGRVWSTHQGEIYGCTCMGHNDGRPADVYMEMGVAYNRSCLARRFDALILGEENLTPLAPASPPPPEEPACDGSLELLGASWDDAPVEGEILTHDGARVVVVAVEGDNLLPDQPLHVELPGHWRFLVRYRCLTS